MRIEDDVDFNESREACSFDGSMHYSFDYAQQVHIPLRKIFIDYTE